MEFQVVNLKENSPSVDEALANFEIALSLAEKSDIKAIKFIHGYGSHGKGGAICLAIRKTVFSLEKQCKIKFFLLGNDWDLQNEKAREIIYACKNLYGDEDLGHQNPGITIVCLK